MSTNQPAADDPVTVIISRRIKSGYEQAFEALLADADRAMQSFEGYQGMQIIRPSVETEHEYAVIFRFDTFEHSKKWEDSAIRAEWLAKIRNFIEGEIHMHHVTGLEYWFTLPGQPALPPPPRYKMAIITVLALFPLINLVSPLLQVIFGTLPVLLRSLLTVIVLVALMTYLVMPFMTRLFAFWLYKRSQ